MSSDVNPFAALLENADVPETENDSLSENLETVFGFTLDKNKSNRYVYFEDLANAFETTKLNMEIIEHALFERTLLPDPRDLMDPSSDNFDPKNCETSVIYYLYDCFKKNENLKSDELKGDVEKLILQNVATALKQPELYKTQKLSEQLYDVLYKLEETGPRFLTSIVGKFREDGDSVETFRTPFTDILHHMHFDILKSNAETFPFEFFVVAKVFTSVEELAHIFLDCSQPKLNTGFAYANTLLGRLFNKSIMPEVPNGRYEFFQESFNSSTLSGIEGHLWSRINKLTEGIHLLVLNLLKCSPAVKLRTLTWLGDLLKVNSDRGKLWNSHAPGHNLPNAKVVTDGFMINFVGVMMKLCRPFCADVNDEKILKVDPTYCAVPNDDCAEKEIHLLDMSKETCLIPATDPRPTSSRYNFVTECFFMGHRAIDLGFRVASDNFVEMNQELSRFQRALQEPLDRSGGRNDAIEELERQLQAHLPKFFSLRCVMIEPNLLADLFNFMSGSAFWFAQVALQDNDESSVNFAPLDSKRLEFPLPERVPVALQCIPEFVIENIVCYLIFLVRFNSNVFEEQGYERLEPILTFILVYMGSSERTRNPHLRARLAEALESLLPYHKDESNQRSTVGVHCEMLFARHPHRKEIVSALLNVFVSIEMTGQSVAFEQKFNYRRPMYTIMDYLWEIAEYKQYFKQLAEEAELNMEAVSPPLFLRFVNLLINDAIYLLDESLVNMSKLREMQIAREFGAWDRLPIHERAQNTTNMHHLGMIAKFDNILGRNTIQTIEYLTSEITIVFTHSTMVDRVSAMLNYFLLNLVGPNQKNFKVKDNKEFSFDPATNVLNISKIYVNLKNSDAFCLAVSQDGRSYNSQLFVLAEDVLVRIGGATIIGELRDVARSVLEKAVEYQKNEEALAEAPEHFLDPIMSTLMRDPVILPSSKQTVDRSTIARHLLSDQTDPFNRAPLFMDQVIPNAELAGEIKKWMEQRNLPKS